MFVVLVTFMLTLQTIAQIAGNVQFINGMNSKIFIEQMIKNLIHTCIFVGFIHTIVFIIEKKYILRAIDYIKNCIKQMAFKETKQFFIDFIMYFIFISVIDWTIINFILFVSKSFDEINWNAYYNTFVVFWTFIGCMIGIGSFGYTVTFILEMQHDKDFYIKQNVQLRKTLKEMNEEFNEMIN